MPASRELNRLLSGPILSTLLRLSAPNVLSMVVMVLVGMAETFYIGRLGTVPLAAMGLVFPFSILTGTMSAGAMGGGVSSAVARALGAGDPARAQVLAFHALLIGLLAGVVYTLIFVASGPLLYRWLGGRDAVYEEAVRYSTVLFSGALFVWVTNTLASMIRGTGNMRVPSAGIIATGVLQILLGGALSLGVGPFQGMGMSGVAIGHILATCAGMAFFAWYLISGQGRLRLRLRGIPAQWALFNDILRVGALACLSPIQTVLTMLVVTGFVARLGVEVLAGYSIGQRLEFLVTPFAFGIGVASVPMIGMAIGAGDIARARRVAWTAGAVSAAIHALIGILVAIVPDLWAALFSADEQVLTHARAFLHRVGPAFVLLGLGMALYFGSQGAGRMLGPVLAGTLRLLLALAGGAWLASRDAPASQYFLLVALAMSAYGLTVTAAVHATRWGPRD